MSWLAQPQPTARPGPGRRGELSEQWIYVLCPQQAHEQLPAELTERPTPSSLLPVRKECGQASHALATEQVTWGMEVSLYSVCTEPVERTDCVGQRGLCAETAFWRCQLALGFPLQAADLTGSKDGFFPSITVRCKRTDQLPVLGQQAAAGDRCQETVVYKPLGWL